jgi:Cof subfamily protein (haloacid dehalogenase superfamily)
MGYRLLVSDIDGTLVNDRREITPRVRRALAAAQAEGVRVCLATGRIWPSARAYVEAAGADPPAILYNGGMVYDFAGAATWMRVPLPRQHALDTIQILRRHAGVQPHLYIDDRVYAPRAAESTRIYQRKDSIPVEIAPDLEALLSVDGAPRDPMKILMIAERPALEAVAVDLEALPYPVNYVFSESIYLEVLPPDVNKGVALRAVAARLDVAREEIIAVGDNLNDLAMIEYAGLGVAMGNAPEALRARADVVAPTNEEHGLSEVIERFILSNDAAPPKPTGGSGPLGDHTRGVRA